MIIAALVTLAIMCISIYSLCVVAGRADERLREYEERDGK